MASIPLPARLVLTLPWLCACLSPPTQLSVNVGGSDIVAPDGTLYASDEGIASGGKIGNIADVSATSNPELYRAYRSGDFKLEAPLANGVYDVTLSFAEPMQSESGMRVFDVLLENDVVLKKFDIRAARHGAAGAAVTRTVPKVRVSDGMLNVSFNAYKGSATLSGLRVRPHRPFNLSAYELLWADEFDTDGPPDEERWNVLLWDARKVNDEAQAYTDNPKNVRVEDGVLVIEAHKEPDLNAQYTSGRVTSKDKGDFLYGRVEVKARLPLGGGTWPAIWLYPTDRFRYSENCGTPDQPRWIPGCAAWPNSGEIDIMEHVGNSPGVVHSSIHTKAYYWVNGQNRKGSVQVDLNDSRFHKYAINWTPDRLTVYVDDTLFFTYLREADGGWPVWPFDHPYHVILNLAIGGNWGARNGGIDDSAFPQRLEIDYVRVYKLSAN